MLICLYFHISDDNPYLRLMNDIGERLDVLLDVLPHRPALNNLHDFTNVDYLFFFH